MLRTLDIISRSRGDRGLRPPARQSCRSPARWSRRWSVNSAPGRRTCTRAVAEGLGVKNPAAVNSPTFVLIQEYPARLPIYHFDAYRLSGPREFAELGVDEYFRGDGVCLVEWADKVSDAAGRSPADRDRDRGREPAAVSHHGGEGTVGRITRDWRCPGFTGSPCRSLANSQLHPALCGRQPS